MKCIVKDNNTNLIKIVFDNDYDYKFAMGGDKDNIYLPSIPYDEKLKSQGYEKYFAVNGSLFFDWINDGKRVYDACGIEVIEGKNNQSTEISTVKDYNNDMACIVKDNKLIFAKQSDILWDVESEQCYCGLTGIGIMLNGCEYPKTVKFASQYNAKSGRTLLGTDKEGNFLSYSIAGETGKSGLYGKELFNIAKQNGFYNCLCLDGGGSVYRFFNGKTDINTTRKIKNTFIIYRKKKEMPTDYKELYEKEKKEKELLSEKISKIKEIVN